MRFFRFLAMLGSGLASLYFVKVGFDALDPVVEQSGATGEELAFIRFVPAILFFMVFILSVRSFMRKTKKEDQEMR